LPANSSEALPAMLANGSEALPALLANGRERPPQIFLDFLTATTPPKDTTLQQLFAVLVKSAGRYPQYVQEMATLPMLRYLSALASMEKLFHRQLRRVFEIDTPALLDEAFLAQVTTLFADRCNDASEHAKPFMDCLSWICTQGQKQRIFPVVVGLDLQTTIFAMVVEAVSQPPPPLSHGLRLTHTNRAAGASRRRAELQKPPVQQCWSHHQQGLAPIPQAARKVRADPVPRRSTSCLSPSASAKSRTPPRPWTRSPRPISSTTSVPNSARSFTATNA
jgi:hypothetical protein